jgi:AmmeMemoRadiSam system protein A
MKLTKSEQKQLLQLSRSALTHIFKKGEELKLNDSDIPKRLKEKRATFVTLTTNGMLRGCIGKLLPQKELYKDVLENTYSAAFSDPRFPQLTEAELADISIEISVLDKPKRLEYKNSKDLVAKLEKEEPGVIIQHGLYSATFLPQVWEELNTPERFLSHLCQKAGLEADTWQKEKLEIQTYKVVKFKEK